jgi:hypothetical protein
MLLHGVADPDRREPPPLSAGALEARRILAETQQAYVNQQEKKMGDMQTALSKVISDWEADTPDNIATTEPKQDKRVTTGVSQATFDYVRGNPGIAKATAIHDLQKQGYKSTSTTTLLSAMIRQKQIIVDTNGGMRTATDHYTPVQYVANKERAPRQAKVDSTPQGLAALYAQPTPVPETTPVPPPPLTAQKVLETLNVKEAFALYRELQKMFEN